MEAYLDHNATTPISPEVLRVLLETYQDYYANPSSTHALGRRAKARYLKAKDEIAACLQIPSKEIFFTQSATEALNWILFHKPYKRIVASKLDHAAVYQSLQVLEKQGTSITWLEAKEGQILPEDFEKQLPLEADLILLGAASSETGIIQEIKPLAKIAKEKGIPLFVDAVALLGKGPFQPIPEVTGYIFASHKIHGPLGVALLTHKKPHELQPWLYGGSQEHKKKAGTENLPAIAGFAHAFQKALHQHPLDVREKRDYFETELAKVLNIEIIGKHLNRIDNTSCIRFKGVSGETLLHLLDEQGVYASHGSACSSGSLEPSRALLAMGLTFSEAKECLRFSFDSTTRYEELNFAIQILTELCQSLLAFT